MKFEINSFDASPILSMSVVSNSAAETQAAIAIVITAVQSITNELQVEAEAPANQLVRAKVLAPAPGAPIESLAAKTKIAMGMAVASLLVVLCAALLFDNQAVRIAARRKRRAEQMLLEHEVYETHKADEVAADEVAADEK